MGEFIYSSQGVLTKYVLSKERRSPTLAQWGLEVPVLGEWECALSCSRGTMF